MGKHSRCVTGICDIGMRYQELQKQHSDVDEDIIMHKLPKGGSVRTARVNAILKDREQRFKKVFIFL